MSRESKKFGVPDELANLYDFANTLDVRHFTHHGVPHPQGDELANARELASWMSQRGLLFKRTAYNFVSLAHDAATIDRSLEILDEALRRL